MLSFKDFLRENNFLARAMTFGMAPLCWQISIEVAQRFGYEDHLLLIGIIGIWVGVMIGHQMYYRWIFPEKNKPNES